MRTITAVSAAISHTYERKYFYRISNFRDQNEVELPGWGPLDVELHPMSRCQSVQFQLRQQRDQQHIWMKAFPGDQTFGVKTWIIWVTRGVRFVS